MTEGKTRRSSKSASDDPSGPDPGGKPGPGLYVVATPIGNLGDLGRRAEAVLKAADVIACEDTRLTRRLTGRFQIATRLTAYHDHNAAKVRPALIARLERGETVALVSDAGTPLVSDPGYRLVLAAHEAGIPVAAVPGPSAALAALMVAGLPTNRFLFAGFLPPRPAARRRAIAELAAVPATLVVFEAARRLASALADLASLLGARPAAVARELTKLHEEVRRGDLATLARHYDAAGPPKGEVVIVIGRAPKPADLAPDDDGIQRALAALLADHPVKQAAAEVAARFGISRREAYGRALALKAGTAPEDGAGD